MVFLCLVHVVSALPEKLTLPSSLQFGSALPRGSPGIPWPPERCCLCRVWVFPSGTCPEHLTIAAHRRQLAPLSPDEQQFCSSPYQMTKTLTLSLRKRPTATCWVLYLTRREQLFWLRTTYSDLVILDSNPGCFMINSETPETQQQKWRGPVWWSKKYCILHIWCHRSSPPLCPDLMELLKLWHHVVLVSRLASIIHSFLISG